MTTKTVTRKELYDLVWSKPMRKLAVDFGMSDVGLAKVCKRHKIPRPSRGYWAKVESGKKVVRWPLVPTDDESLQTITLHREESPAAREDTKRPSVDPEIAALIEAESLPENKIAAETDLRGADPLIRATRESLSNARPDKYGRVSRRYDFQGPCFDVAVSKANIQRALLILHSLVKAIRSRGYDIGEHDQKSRQPYVDVLGRRFRVSVWEPSKQQEKKLTKQEKAEKERYSWFSRDYDYQPSGILELHLDRGSYSSAARICDKVNAKVEQRLNELFVHMFKAIVRARVAEEECQRAAAEAEVRKRLAVDKEVVVRTNDVRVARLLRTVPKWEETQRVRAFVQAVHSEATRRFDVIDESSEIGQWLRWADQYLESIDPLSDNRDLPTYSLTPNELEQLRKECKSDWCSWSKTFRPRQPR
ncbi:MAG: hypothetical protein ACYC6Y_09105 [Thermoguttaceae bacterium]